MWILCSKPQHQQIAGEDEQHAGGGHRAEALGGLLSLRQALRQPFVLFNREYLGSGIYQGACQVSQSRANFKDHILGIDSGCADDCLEICFINEKILSQ